MFLVYILLALAALAGFVGLGTGYIFVGIPLLLVAGGIAVFVLFNRGMKAQLSRRTGQHEVPSSLEASHRPAMDPSHPFGGTTADAGDSTGSVGRG